MFLTTPDFLSPSEPIGFLWLDVQVRFERIRRGDLDAGASAIEWVIITFALAAIAIVVYGLIKTKIVDKAKSIKTS